MLTIDVDADRTFTAIYDFPDLVVPGVAATASTTDRPIVLTAQIDNRGVAGSGVGSHAHVLVDPLTSPPTSADLPLLILDVPALAAGATTSLSATIPGRRAGGW